MVAGAAGRTASGRLVAIGPYRAGVDLFGLFIGTPLPPSTFGFFLLGALFVTTLARWRFPDLPAWFLGEDSHHGAGRRDFCGVRRAALAQTGRLGLEPPIQRRRHPAGGGLRPGMFGPLHRRLDHRRGQPRPLRRDSSTDWCGRFVLSAPAAAMRFWTAGLVAAHGLLWIPFDQIVHPAENGRYHWWLAETTDDPALKIASYRAAVTADPGLGLSLVCPGRSGVENRAAAGSLANAVGGLEGASRFGARGRSQPANLERIPHARRPQAGWETSWPG